MTKKINLLLILTLVVSSSFGQTLHTFLFCKTSDPKIGNSVKINYGNMQEAAQIIASNLEYTYKEYPLTGNSFNAINVQRTIASAVIKPEDIVILYFSTHGAKSKWDSNIFPQIDIPDSLVSAYKVHKQLTDKKPKSIITMIEACSGFQRITPQQSFIYQNMGDDIDIEKSITYKKENIKKIFLTNCNTIITAGQPGKNTWATSEGSMFTNCFLRAFGEYSDLEDINKVSWDNLLQQCKQYTYDMTRFTSIKYYPVWEKINCFNDSTIQTSSIDTSAIRNNISLKIECKKQIRTKNPYDIELKLIGDKAEISKIAKVVYFLDETMPKPTVTVSKNTNNFYYGYFSISGEFPIKAKVYYLDGKIVDLYENIDFKNCK